MNIAVALAFLVPLAIQSGALAGFLEKTASATAKMGVGLLSVDIVLSYSCLALVMALRGLELAPVVWEFPGALVRAPGDVVFTVLAAGAEELARVVFLHWLLLRGWGEIVAVGVVAMCFLMSHASQPAEGLLGVVLSGGVLYSVAWLRTRNFLAIWGSHAAYNLIVLMTSRVGE